MLTLVTLQPFVDGSIRVLGKDENKIKKLPVTESNFKTQSLTIISEANNFNYIAVTSNRSSHLLSVGNYG